MVIQQTQNSKNRALLLLVMMSFTILFSLLTFSFSVSVMSFILTLVTMIFMVRMDYKRVQIYVIIFIVSMCFVFFVYYVNQTTYGSPYYIGGSDDLKFEEVGEAVAESKIYNPQKLLGTVLSKYDALPFFYSYMGLLVNFSNNLDGYSTYLPRFMNVYYLLWICMILHYFLKKYANFSDKSSNISIAIFALTPNIQYINSHVFRDTFNLLQIVLILFLFDKLLTNQKHIGKIFLVGGLALVIYLTYYTRKNGLVFAGVLGLLMLSIKLKIKMRYVLIPLIPIVFMSNFISSINILYYIENYSNYVLNIAGDGLSSYVFRQPLLPFGIVLRVVYAFITPFPNFFGLFRDSARFLYDIMMFLIYCGVIIQIVAIPFILKRLAKVDWLTLSFLAWFLAIVATTFTFRHIMFYYLFMVPVALDGYRTSSKKTRSQFLFLSVIMGVLLALVYLSLKVFS